MEFQVQTLSNRPTKTLTLTAEVVSFGSSSKLVLIIPSQHIKTLKQGVPYSCCDLDSFGLPNRPVIVLADGQDLADYSLYQDQEFTVQIGNTEKWTNDYVIHYRAPVTGEDIDAFNAEIGKTTNPNNIWKGLAQTHVLIGTDLIESQTSSAFAKRMLYILSGLIIALFAISTVSNIMFFADITAGHNESLLAIISELLAALFSVWAAFIVIFFITSRQHPTFLIMLISLAAFMLIDRVILTIAYIG